MASRDKLTDVRRSWFPNELMHAGRENLDEGHVRRYDTKEDAGAASEVELLQSLGLSKDSLMLEYGPGTGQVTVAAAAVCARVLAVDVSAPMLAELAAKVRALGLDNVDLIRDGFLSYEHRGGPVDFAYSRLALHHLPDFWKTIALNRIRATLEPGGVFRLADVVWSFDAIEAEQRIEAWCATTEGRDIANEWERSELEEHVRDEHSTFTWLLEPMIERSGFVIEHIDYSADGVFASYILRAA